MAIARGAGTEIIRAHHFEYIASNTSTHKALIGVQHHIYTVLSIIITPVSVTAGSLIHCYILGYDSVAGTGSQTQHFFYQEMNTNETFVWNDKFSFNGYEPADFASGGLTVAADQDKLADQGGGSAQYLAIDSQTSGDNLDVFVTFIDQNNA